MQSTASSTQGSAFSPVMKQRFEGYPSPPSSGRTDHQAGPDCQQSGDDHAGEETMKVEARTIDVTISPRQEAMHHSLSPPASVEEEEEDEYEDDEEYEEDLTIIAINRSSSSSSRSNSVEPSSPSTSIGTMHQRVDTRARSPYNQDELPIAPIRDTPRNPFLQGGPADVGISGPHREGKRMPTRPMHRERGKMTYVFRGQRVTYADPYTSDSEDDDDSPSSSGKSLMDRLQPKLLFPSIGKAAVRSPCVTIKKSDVIPTAASRPTLESVIQRASYKTTKTTHNQSLMERINRAGWSDEEDELHHEQHCKGTEDVEEEDDVQLRDEDVPQKYIAAVPRPIEGEFDDDFSDDDMVAEDDNPFMEPSSSHKPHNQMNVDFLQRIQQAQAASSALQSRVGVVRPTYGGHRYKPYGQDQRHSQAHYKA